MFRLIIMPFLNVCDLHSMIDDDLTYDELLTQMRKEFDLAIRLGCKSHAFKVLKMFIRKTRSMAMDKLENYPDEASRIIKTNTEIRQELYHHFIGTEYEYDRKCSLETVV